MNGYLLGRLQPLTISHSNIIEKMKIENDNVTILLVKGKGTSKDKGRNPLCVQTQIELIKEVHPDVNVEIISTGYFPDYIEDMSKATVYTGTDRLKAYTNMAKDSGVTIKEIERTDDDISASKVRQSLIDDDYKSFQTMTPIEIHKYYDRLKSVIKGK